MKGMPAIVSVVVVVILAVVVLKVLGALIGFAVKLVLLAVAVGIGFLVYQAVNKQIGGPRG
jgi:hypothetical protein